MGGRLLPAACVLACALGCAVPPRLPWREPAEPEAQLPPLVAHPPAELPAPKGVRAISGEYRQIPLQWDPLLRVDVGGYRIERAAAREGPFTPLHEVWGRGMVVRVDGAETPLADGVTWFYRIRPFTPEGRLGDAASEVVVGTTAPLPDPPEGLRAYSRQPREVPLSWQASEDPTVAGYRVERSPSPDGPFERIADLEGRHAIAWVDGDLGDLRVFYYRVASLNPAGDTGPWSAAVRAVTKPEPLPPLGLEVAEQRLGVNVLTWEPNVERDIEAYRVYRMSEDAPPERVAVVPATANRFEHVGVEAGETNSYVLTAVDREGLESRPSEPVSATGPRYDLAADATPERVRLRWNPRTEEGFVAARVERDGWLGSRVLGTSSDGEFEDPDVEPGVVYRYVVVLLGGPSDAPPSEPVDVRVPERVDLP